MSHDRWWTAALLLLSLAWSGDPASALAHRLIAFPTGHYYPPPIADLHRAAFGVTLAEVYDESIADSGSPRYFLRVGGEFGLLRWEADDPASISLQLDLIAGMDGQFDLDRALDNIGWDGNYGLQASTRLAPAWAVKLGLVHTSSHIGDEFEERTGRQRIGYSRDELQVGVRHDLGRDISVYGEAGYGYDLSVLELQEPWRLQTGLDFDPALAATERRTGWFVGLDLRRGRSATSGSTSRSRRGAPSGSRIASGVSGSSSTTAGPTWASSSRTPSATSRSGSGSISDQPRTPPVAAGARSSPNESKASSARR